MVGPDHGGCIVALAPDAVELLFALGAGGRLCAVAPAADAPPEAGSLPRVNPSDVEAILVRHPDLVVATTAGNDPIVVHRLRALGTRVFTLDVTSFDRLEEAARLLGQAAGDPEAGISLATTLHRRRAAAAAKAVALPRRRALFVVWWDPLIVAGPGTFHDDLLREARLQNIAPRGTGRYPRLDPEVLLSPDLQVLVSPDEADVRAGFSRVMTTPAGSRLSREEVQTIWLPADPASRPGPRLPDALAVLVGARLAHP